MAQLVGAASTTKEAAEVEAEVEVEDSMMVLEVEGLAVPAVRPRYVLFLFRINVSNKSSALEGTLFGR
jgi:hypothetical protein